MRIQLLAFLLFLQSFAACQQVDEKTLPLTASLDMLPATTQQCLDIAKDPVANILFRSTDGGQNWQDISEGLPSDKSISSFSVQNGEVLMGNADGLYSSPANATNLIWEKELLLNTPIQHICPSQAGRYAISSQSILFQSMSQNVWIPVFTDLNSKGIRTMMETSNGTVFVGTDSGLFKSTDHGKTWKHVHENGWIIKMVESNGVLICTNQSGILRSDDGGEHWDLVVSEGGVGIEAEVIEGGFAVITYNTESKTRRVRISTDGGKTWQAIDAGLPPSDMIASIKQVGASFFCGHPAGIFRSADRGKTWELILPAVKEKVFNLSVSGAVMYAIPRNGGC